MNVRGLATAITAAAGCAAIGLIVASCSNSAGSPVAPGNSSNLAAHLDASPTPDVSPTQRANPVANAVGHAMHPRVLEEPSGTLDQQFESLRRLPGRVSHHSHGRYVR